MELQSTVIRHGVCMDHVYQVKLGDSRRLALPADLCRELDLHPGEELLLTAEGDRLSVTSLRHQADQVRVERRAMRDKGHPLTADLKALRQTEAAREAGPR